MNDDVEALRPRLGTYSGHGINHEDQPFHGELRLTPLLDRGIALAFRAVGIDGTVYHDERSWIAPDEAGEVRLWSIHTNGRGVQVHTRRNGAPDGEVSASLVYGAGDRGDPAVFRVEITLDLWPDGDITYRFAWGLSGGEFKGRSSVRMRPAEAARVAPEA